MKLILITALLCCIIATGARDANTANKVSTSSHDTATTEQESTSSQDTATSEQESTSSQDTATTEQESTSSQDTTSAESTTNAAALSSSTESLKRVSIEEHILKLITEQKAEIHSSNNFLSEIENAINHLAFNVQQQIDQLPQFNLTRQQLANTNELAQNQTEQVLQKLLKTSQEANSKMDRTTNNIEFVMQQQEVVKAQINRMQNRLNSYQQNLLNSTESIDRNLLQLTEIVALSVLPRLQSLNSSFISLNRSQWNINLELENVASVRELNQAALAKLNSLHLQMTYLNVTQSSKLRKITEAIRYDCTKKETLIEKGLQDLLVAQQSIFSKLAVCENKSTKPKSYELTTSPAYKTSEIYRSATAESRSRLPISPPSYYVYDTAQSSKPSSAYSSQIVEPQPRLNNIIFENTATKSEQKASDYYSNDMSYSSKPSEHAQYFSPQGKEYNKNDLSYDFIDTLATKSQDIIKPDAQLSKSVVIYSGNQNQFEDGTNHKYIVDIARTQPSNENYKNTQFKSKQSGNTYYGNGFSTSYAQVG